ncbi:MAG: ABC transporter permease [Sulfolobales archaeon]
MIKKRIYLILREFIEIYRGGLVGFSVLTILVAISLIGPLIYRVDPYQTNYSQKIIVYTLDLGNQRIIYKKSLDDLAVKKIEMFEDKMILLDSNGDLLMSNKDLSNIKIVTRGIKDFSIDKVEHRVFILTFDEKICSLDLRNIEGFSLNNQNCLPAKETNRVLASRDLLILVSNKSIILFLFASSKYLETPLPRQDLTALEICGNYLLLGFSSGDLYTINILSNLTITHQRIYRGSISNILCVSGGVAYLLGEKGFVANYNVSSGEYYSLYLDTTRSIVDGYLIKDQVYLVDDMGTIFIILSNGQIKKLDYVSLENTKRLFIDENSKIYLIGYGIYAETLSPPSWKHLLGTDYLGRDIFAQIMMGIKISLFIGALVSLIVLLIGSTLGLLAGYFRGRVDLIISSAINFTYSIPLEPFAIILAMTIRPGLHTVVLAISLLIWRTTARIVRSQTIVVSSLPMIEAARALGASSGRVIFRHVLPMIMPIILIDFANTLIYAILAESTLSFIGVGPQNIFTLGSILNAAYVTGSWRIAWWTITPGIFIGLIVWSIYMIIRSLEPRFNPKLRYTQQNNIKII